MFSGHGIFTLTSVNTWNINMINKEALRVRANTCSSHTCVWEHCWNKLLMTLVLVSGFGYQFAGNGYQLFVMRHFFCVMCWRITQHVRGRGWEPYEKSGALQKKVMHYKKLVPESRKLVPETTNKNHCYCRSRWNMGVLVLLLVHVTRITWFYREKSISMADLGGRSGARPLPCGPKFL